MTDETPPPDDRQPGYYYVEGLPGVWYVWRAAIGWTAHQERDDKPTISGNNDFARVCLETSLIDGRRRQLQPVAKGPWG